MKNKSLTFREEQLSAKNREEMLQLNSFMKAFKVNFKAKHPTVHFAIYSENPKVEKALFAMENNKNTDPKNFVVGKAYYE